MQERHKPTMRLITFLASCFIIGPSVCLIDSKIENRMEDTRPEMTPTTKPAIAFASMQTAATPDNQAMRALKDAWPNIPKGVLP